MNSLKNTSAIVPEEKVMKVVTWMDILAMGEDDCNSNGLVNGKTCVCGLPEKFLK